MTAIDPSKLRISLEEGERWRRTLRITVPSEILARERRAAARKLSGRVNLPGFRKGKVPPEVVEKKFGPALDREVLDRVIQDAYKGALDERALRPVSEGEVGDVQYEPDSDLTFRISFDVAPEFELARTGGFKVERPALQVGDEQVEEVLTRIRKQEGTWRPVEEGTPEDGDLVTVRIQRLAEEGDEPRRYEFTLGEGEAIPDIEEAIRSLEVGSSGDFTVTFPPDFPDEERRGDEDRLRIFLDGRKTLELPDLDDDFAASVGDFESVEALREKILEDLTREAEEEADAHVRGALMEQILEANEFQVPESMIDQYIRGMLGNSEELTDERLREVKEEVRPRAEYAVKRYLVMRKLAEDHELEATEDDLDGRVQEIAERSDTTPGEVYARLQKSGRLESLEQEITDRKVFDFLKEQSTITDAAG